MEEFCNLLYASLEHCSQKWIPLKSRNAEINPKSTEGRCSVIKFPFSKVFCKTHSRFFGIQLISLSLTFTWTPLFPFPSFFWRLYNFVKEKKNFWMISRLHTLWEVLFKFGNSVLISLPEGSPSSRKEILFARVLFSINTTQFLSNAIWKGRCPLILLSKQQSPSTSKSLLFQPPITFLFSVILSQFIPISRLYIFTRISTNFGLFGLAWIRFRNWKMSRSRFIFSGLIVVVQLCHAVLMWFTKPTIYDIMIWSQWNFLTFLVWLQRDLWNGGRKISILFIFEIQKFTFSSFFFLFSLFLFFFLALCLHFLEVDVLFPYFPKQQNHMNLSPFLRDKEKKREKRLC